MTIQIIGNEEIVEALEEIIKNLKQPEIVTEGLEQLLDDYVPVRTGYLKDSLERNDWILEYAAPYAGVVEDRQQFVQRAIDNFDFEKYADKVVEPY